MVRFAHPTHCSAQQFRELFLHMLKALELVGFKSFADRTRFEFPQGITVVVGPNGSGKSNVVDAIKWVLGEQSVKSLRGREMADVIFNGSGGRRATNAAEVTLTFDNSKHLLDVDTPEVHITRRVYRSGEGEYLVNRTPARLRDIRDLLSGTGMGTQAYSVIEQGKVDVLLQSSARDRRVIFEEAAGISRFKIRKIEALRRLERVEQNLLRLSDIVDEVENRLRSVRIQAGKARRYKEHADRLQELRTQVGLVDWKRLSDRLAALDGELETHNDGRNTASATAERLEAELLELDVQNNEINEQVRQAESQIAGNRERIAAAEATIEHGRSRETDLEQEISRCRRQLVTMNGRAGDVQRQLLETTESLEAAEEDQQETAKRLVEAERGLTEIMASLDHLRGANQERRAAYMQQMRLSAAMGNENSALESQAAAAAALRERCGQRIAELDQVLGGLQTDLDGARRQRAELTEQSQQQTERLTSAKEQLADRQQQQTSRQNELSQLLQRHGAASERAAVLEELVRRHDGVSDGVKEVLARAADPADATFPGVCGLVADLFHASVEAAPLVEIALGQAAGHIVAERSTELLDGLQHQSGRLAGRVGFLWLDGKNDVGPYLPAKRSETVSLEGQPGVLGRSDRFVETEARFLPLAQRLLGRTWFVEKLSHALHLAASAGRGLTFVTLAGDLLEADGTLVVGPRNASSGLISRRSQLRALQGQLTEWQTAIETARSAVETLNDEIADAQQQVEQRSTEHQSLLDALAENRIVITTAEERRTQLDRQRAGLEEELHTRRSPAYGRLEQSGRRPGTTRAARPPIERDGIGHGAARPGDRRAGRPTSGGQPRDDRD